jgi:hypothetical protein
MMTHYICEQLEELAEKIGATYIEDNATQTLRIESVGEAKLGEFVPFIKQYAYNKGFKKLSVKVSDAQAIYFFQHGFSVEASILAYFGLQDAIFLEYFFDEHVSQITEKQSDIINKVLSLSDEVVTKNTNVGNDENIIVTSKKGLMNSPIKRDHAIVFSGRKILTDAGDSMTFTAARDGRLIASAKAQFYTEDKAVEFSEFIIHLDADIRHSVTALLNHMQTFAANKGYDTAFTIVSANSLAINSLCADNHFEFGGTLKNESLTNGNLSHLNTWFKRL